LAGEEVVVEVEAVAGEEVVVEVEAEAVVEAVAVEVATWSSQSTSRLQCSRRTETGGMGMGLRDAPFPVPLGVHGRFPRGLHLRLTW
jgi:hypothetical protein